MKKLSNKIVSDVYFFTGTVQEINKKFGVSARVAKRIKYGQTYTDITFSFGEAGEIKIHKLTWDNICDIRSSDESASNIAKKYGITKETVYNIKNGKTRKYK